MQRVKDVVIWCSKSALHAVLWWVQKSVTMISNLLLEYLSMADSLGETKFI